ncbi:kinase-like protein [Gloeophyllum trabeum ATCC 11539]|uniref:non-specific serine/threonine protein kinase n=1 Tax=Gloeophyllum trabeum (strain ATCC 11539 / FP-39264 / Madison 617) TaxID=670483 RepID=S7QE34_GLOTA|nr:kinase-like protein [Gloeophyllum trabeum ATCC 11539]EPQ57548.1 kinase-like protein [Gloeophyllum trabeum ATCC 11539]
MAYPSFRPLPTPPSVVSAGYFNRDDDHAVYPDVYAYSNPYYAPFPPRTPPIHDQPRTTLPGGTLLHKGFYDLLSMIPTPSPSRFLWGGQGDEPIAGPRYEDIGTNARPPPTAPVVMPASPPGPTRRGRKISKDMVSKPTGFIHLVHASDADQAEALLRRWGPDGMGKLGDPRWADPIKDRVRATNQAKAVNEVVNALKPSMSRQDQLPPLRVVNGMSTTSSSVITTAARENVSVSPTVDGLPGQPGNSTIRWGGGLMVHPEHEHEDEEEDAALLQKDLPAAPQTPRRPITPSLATLEKAVAARIYFENLYFPLLRQPPSREQRRLAMERDMMNMQLTEAQKENLRARWRQNETDYLRERRRKVDPSGFIKLKTIGHGAFGVVSLVRERSSGQLYAMKQLRKTDMLRKGQEGHVRAERDILKSASLVSSPGGAEWIVKLHYSFQDRDHLYLVLDYMGGGDLLNLLIERDVFEEDFTRFYVAEMVLAIEACHKHGFIHRDIKPDNFLFDPSGHIKLSDFGLATDLHWAHDTSYYEQQRLHLLHKHGIDLEDSLGIADGTRTKRMNRKDVEMLMGGGDGQGGIFTWREKNRRKLAYSVCGTNSYMSPEVIRGHGYTYSCDWWSLGVIMFECLYGYPPFVSNSRHVTRQKILNWRQSLRFPSRPRVSHEGVDLMQQLLCEPEDRLGSQASASTTRPNSLVMQARRSGFVTPTGMTGSVDGAELIKAHPWFRGIDWENMHRYPAPYRPDLRNPEDTRHFDQDIPPEPLAPANGAPADATRDPLLRDKVHGQEILEVRKALAFAGFTHKSPRPITYVRADKAFDPQPDTYGQEEAQRGRSTVRSLQDVGKGRAMSL